MVVDRVSYQIHSTFLHQLPFSESGANGSWIAQTKICRRICHPHDNLSACLTVVATSPLAP